jgi:hypothetical protein
VLNPVVTGSGTRKVWQPSQHTGISTCQIAVANFPERLKICVYVEEDRERLYIHVRVSNTFQRN